LYLRDRKTEEAKTARKGGTSGSDVRIAGPREVQLENLPADHPAAQTARLRQLFGLIVLLALGFTLLSEAAFLAFHDATVGITGAILFGFGCLVLVARSRLRQDNRREAVTMLCLGILGTTLIIMVLQPSWNATLAVTPLLTVGVALPYVGDRPLKLLIVTAWMTTAAVTVLSELLSPSSPLPGWYDAVFRISSLLATAAVLLLILWQFRWRLMGTLIRTRAAEERYALAERGANDGLWDWDVTSESIYFSPRWKEMLGCSEERIGGHPEDWFHRIHPSDRARFEDELAAHLDGSSRSFQSEYRILHEDGRYRWVLTRGQAVRDENGNPVRMAGSQTDITQRKQTEEQALHDATHDALTGLPNRILLSDRLGKTLARAKKDAGYRFAVLFLDFDRFKNVNDSLGHSLGDMLLKEIARRIEACVHPTDTVARLGGDEFVVLLEDLADAADAPGVAERLQKKFKKDPFKLYGHELFTTASIGMVVGSSDYDEPEEILRDADTAMYKAKEWGGACHAVFDSAMHTRAVSLLKLETDLRRAVERGEFVVYYQPIVWLESGQIVGFEALARWEHPERGLIPPGEFVPLAEETDLISSIDMLVLREACIRARLWQEGFPDHQPLTVSVNLSPAHLARPGLVEEVARILELTGFDGRNLCLELTEGAIMRDPEAAIETLSRLKGLGVSLHVDDFGTGYSALGLLRRFPVNALKIDRSFVAGMDEQDENVEIVQTISTLAHQLGMDVVAEGVERPGQLRRLREIGCDYGQGYRFSKPVAGEVVEAILTAEPSW
jgi:diguanylate cyclase (GGDEF)-like protein/PAS domain S-box-containing protein